MISRFDLSVAMCTFNGARYLRPQLESIAMQTVLPDELVICDDRSEDKTPAIVQEFSRIAQFEVRFLRNNERLGVVRNFEHALSLCRGRYVALADQDDIWMQEKLERMVTAVRDAETQPRPGACVLVHTDLSLINAEGKLLESSFFRRRRFRQRHKVPLDELLLQNYVTGCATLVNRPVLDLALPFPEGVSIHDWWLALIAAAAGRVVTLNWPGTLYRTHGENLIGAKRGTEWRSYLLNPPKARRLFLRALRQSEALEQRLRERGANNAVAARIARLNGYAKAGGLRAASWVALEGFKLQSPLATLAFVLQLRRGMQPA